MIQCKVLKQLENLEQQKYDDEDITEDIKFLLERLGESVQDLRYPVDPKSSIACSHLNKPFIFWEIIIKLILFCSDIFIFILNVLLTVITFVNQQFI